MGRPGSLSCCPHTFQTLTNQPALRMLRPPRMSLKIATCKNVRKTKRQGSSTGAANKQASSPTPLPPPRTRNFCAIAHEHDGVDGPAQCGHDATRGEAKASSAGWSTHCHTRTQSHTPRVRTPPRPRTIGNARSRSRSRKGGESARPILSPAGTPLRALTLLSEERSDGAPSAYAPRSHARGRARTYCTVVG